MPSGRGSSGSSGSHFGGGSHSFSSRSGSGTLSFTRYRELGFVNGKRVVFINKKGTYYLSWIETFRVVTSIFVWLLLIVEFVFGILLSNFKANVGFIEHDYYRYQKMIENAEYQRDTYGIDDYFVMGEVVSYRYNANAGKYYINYIFKDDDGANVHGYTYSIYAKEEAIVLYNQGYISLVVDDRIITQMTDSINYDYKNMPMEKDGEYEKAINNYKRFKVVLIVFSISSGVGILILIVTRLTAKNKKDTDPLNKLINETIKSKEFKEGVKRNQELNKLNSHQDCLDCNLNETYENNKQEIINDIKTVKKYCMYCGAVTMQNVKKCPNCKADLNW